MKRTVITTAFSYPLIWDRGHLDIRVGEEVFEVDFQRQYREQGDGISSPGWSAGYSSSSNVEMPYDRLGRVAYTRVDIWFPMHTDKSNGEEIQKWIHKVVNRLLEVYRYTTEEFYVDTIPVNELWDYEVMETNEDGRTFPSPVEVRKVLPLGYGVRLARFASVTPEAQRVLRDGSELPISRVLFSNAKREQFLENYRLAVVEAQSAFETLIDQVVSQFYKGQGASNGEIANKLEAGLKNLIKDHIPKCCGQRFDGTTVHTEWRNDLYNLRNAVVHAGASVSAEQAEQALGAAEKAIEWINKHCP